MSPRPFLVAVGATLLFVLTPPNAAAQVTFSGQLRPRTELRDPSGA